MAMKSALVKSVTGIMGAVAITAVLAGCDDHGSSDEAVTNTDDLEKLVSTPTDTDGKGTTQGLHCFKNVNERNAVWVRIQAAIDSGNKVVTPEAPSSGEAAPRYTLHPPTGNDDPARCFIVMRSNESLTPPPK